MGEGGGGGEEWGLRQAGAILECVSERGARAKLPSKEAIKLSMNERAEFGRLSRYRSVREITQNSEHTLNAMGNRRKVRTNLLIARTKGFVILTNLFVVRTKFHCSIMT